VFLFPASTQYKSRPGLLPELISGDEGAHAGIVGLPVLKEGTAAVIDALAAAGVLLKEERYAHKYPYDWRTKLPTIFRATDQARSSPPLKSVVCTTLL
jgi:isoleucyl-tRNA synthetase